MRYFLRQTCKNRFLSYSLLYQILPPIFPCLINFPGLDHLHISDANSRNRIFMLNKETKANHKIISKSLDVLEELLHGVLFRIERVVLGHFAKDVLEFGVHRLKHVGLLHRCVQEGAHHLCESIVRKSALSVSLRVLHIDFQLLHIALY